MTQCRAYEMTQLHQFIAASHDQNLACTVCAAIDPIVLDLFVLSTSVALLSLVLLIGLDVLAGIDQSQFRDGRQDVSRSSE